MGQRPNAQNFSIMKYNAKRPCLYLNPRSNFSMYETKYLKFGDFSLLNWGEWGGGGGVPRGHNLQGWRGGKIHDPTPTHHWASPLARWKVI